MYAGSLDVGEFEFVQDRGAANLAGYQTDVPNAVIQGRANEFGFRAAMAGDHHRGGVGWISVAPRVIAQHAAQLH